MAKITKPKKATTKNTFPQKTEKIQEIPGNFAIIKTGGHQYKVKVGDELKVEKLATKDKLEFIDLLNHKKVKASVIGESKAQKVTILKFRAKKRYRRFRGHRQKYSLIKIESIS